MKLCRFNDTCLGLVEGHLIRDVTAVLDGLPSYRWAHPLGDAVIAALDDLRPSIEEISLGAPTLPLAQARLNAPVATPSKIIGAPVNYLDHIQESHADQELHQNRAVHPIDEIGCFIKANSALCGPQSTINLPFHGQRVDFEAEVAVVIGKPAYKIQAKEALSYVAGYALALDMTVRGKQDRSLRKSCDCFAVVGPWLTTADEIEDSAAIAFSLRQNGQERQSSHTGLLVRSIPELIEMTSAFYTLLPGDVIMTGTPSGVGPVEPGDELEMTSPQLGRFAVTIGRLPVDGDTLIKLSERKA
jgi:2,4-didehydro-3-deoxy-L-rhamnonate hydrolase